MPNVWNAIVFTGDRKIGMKGYIKYRKIQSKERFLLFVNNKYPKWIFINWIDRVTGVRTTEKRRRY